MSHTTFAMGEEKKKLILIFYKR